jgi:hypothetical protein
MIETFDMVLAQALKLPDEDRRTLIARLLDTLMPGDAKCGVAWDDTIEPRLAAIADKSETTVPWPGGHPRLGDKMHDDLGEALDVGIAELDRGQCTESSIDEFMTEIDAAVGLTP